MEEQKNGTSDPLSRGLQQTPEQIVAELLSSRKPRPDLGNYCAPEGEVEMLVSQIWCEVLRLETVGRDDNIFDLGGDSLRMTQIAARIWRCVGVRVPIDMFFANLTVAKLAGVIQECLGN